MFDTDITVDDKGATGAHLKIVPRPGEDVKTINYDADFFPGFYEVYVINEGSNPYFSKDFKNR